MATAIIGEHCKTTAEFNNYLAERESNVKANAYRDALSDSAGCTMMETRNLMRSAWGAARTAKGNLFDVMYWTEYGKVLYNRLYPKG